MWILRLNMTDRTCRLEEVPAAYKNLGGRGLTSAIVCAEVPPLCHPLRPEQQARLCPRPCDRHNGPHIGPHLRRGEVSAHGGYQGGERRFRLAPAPGLDADQGPDRGRSAQGERKVLDGLHCLGCRGRKPKRGIFSCGRISGKDLYEVFPKLFERFGKKQPLRAPVSPGNTGMGIQELSLTIWRIGPAGIADAAAWARSWPAKG